MGKNRNNRKANNFYDSSDDDSLSSTSTGMSELVLSHETEHVTSREDELEKYLDALYEKRGSTREKALSGLIDAFESRVVLGFIENKCVTLLHQFINSIKRGSAKEASLASRAIGLLAITVGCGSSAHEVMEESIPQLSQALKSGSDALKRSSVLDCLAIISFIGGNDVQETEKSMKIIWELIHPKSGSNVAVPKPTPSVLAAGVSAWTFLLTTIKEWRISSTNWHESVSFLSTLLDKDDRSVRNAAGEAIAIIFEVGRLDKYSKEANGCSDGSDLDSGKAHGVFASVEALKGKLLNQVRDLSMEAGGKGLTKKDLNTQRDLFQDILVFIENGEHPEVSVKIQSNCDMLTLTTWTSIVQLNFLKRFLGSGFLKHMQDNDMLHDVFDFTPKRKENLSVKEKRLFKSPNSASNKERTQYLNKRRTWAQDRNLGHFAEASEDF